LSVHDSYKFIFTANCTLQKTTEAIFLVLLTIDSSTLDADKANENKVCISRNKQYEKKKFSCGSNETAQSDPAQGIKPFLIGAYGR
jgi:hypothetical protein